VLFIETTYCSGRCLSHGHQVVLQQMVDFQQEKIPSTGQTAGDKEYYVGHTVFHTLIIYGI